LVGAAPVVAKLTLIDSSAANAGGATEKVEPKKRR